jgi:hypothetical protein
MSGGPRVAVFRSPPEARIVSEMFEASERFEFFDYFRVPYRIVPRGSRSAMGAEPLVAPAHCGSLRRTDIDGAVPTLSWPLAAHSSRLPESFAVLGSYTMEGQRIFGHVVGDDSARRLLPAGGRGWEATTRLTDERGQTVASVWRDGSGNVFLPFDPGQSMWYAWSEGYRNIRSSAATTKVRTAALRTYYTIRPFLPRPVQIWIRRMLAKAQGSPTFPRWPMETALHDLYAWLFDLVAGFAGTPVPWIDVWPDDHTWAIVLTHDVETRTGYERVRHLRDVERGVGLVSSWNFVPLRMPEQDRYEVKASMLGDLRREGCEVGVHGLHHDGRDLESLRTLVERLPAIRSFAERWEAVGFRAPATQRDWDLMPLLGFDYDSSFSDSAPYEPIPGGCCSYLPFLNENLVELPITLAQDHTLFAILGERDGSSWLEKASAVRGLGGMVLVLTHPDYTDDVMLQAYRQLLEAFADDPGAWRALPREVSAWWRRRAESWLEESGEGWEVRGPAATEGRVRISGARSEPQAKTQPRGAAAW